jgi:hypothetical protein
MPVVLTTRNLSGIISADGRLHSLPHIVTSVLINLILSFLLVSAIILLVCTEEQCVYTNVA